MVVDNMEWSNVYELTFVVAIMIPYIVFSIKYKDGFINKWNSKYVEIIEQVGKFGCFAFMIVNIPGTWFGWWSDEAFIFYLFEDAIFVMIYCVVWIVCIKKSSIFRALALSIISSILFLYSESWVGRCCLSLLH